MVVGALRHWPAARAGEVGVPSRHAAVRAQGFLVLLEKFRVEMKRMLLAA